MTSISLRYTQASGNLLKELNNRKRRKRMSKAEKCVFLISFIFMLCVTLSFFDIISHNMTDYNYASWNAIEIFYKVAIK